MRELDLFPTFGKVRYWFFQGLENHHLALSNVADGIRWFDAYFFSPAILITFAERFVLLAEKGTPSGKTRSV